MTKASVTHKHFLYCFVLFSPHSVFLSLTPSLHLSLSLSLIALFEIIPRKEIAASAVGQEAGVEREPIHAPEDQHLADDALGEETLIGSHVSEMRRHTLANQIAFALRMLDAALHHHLAAFFADRCCALPTVIAVIVGAVLTSTHAAARLRLLLLLWLQSYCGIRMRMHMFSGTADAVVVIVVVVVGVVIGVAVVVAAMGMLLIFAFHFWIAFVTCLA